MKSILLSFVFTIFLTGCGLETLTIDDYYKKNLEDVSEIEVVDGSNGNSRATTNKEEILSFIKEVKDITFIPAEDQSERDGFLYSITFYEGDKATIQFVLNEIGDDYYNTEPDIEPIVEEFFSAMSEQD
ncbi:hypothetical protein D0S48_18395 [Psychrobacillus sp. AK 1817]|uniref:hypothetical protein n=1 Tax=Psychrobacillus sp. AK 1817 TaxID=2303505 RepID=UPI001248A0D7|nr:hypothetical protein [Psychrobacillus sp. AK 1817]QEY22469.1 hypothetical protein D0S48_18395 [Psychrobacillus sp. AK 1817]